MSGAQYGYVDLSSADKGAADETDEVDLQMLCLTGEGVTLSVPRSMLWYDLRRLVSQKIPCKPGAKLAVHHVNGKLTLDQTLGEQGIVGKSVMLSRTYVPTNVYTAWRYACGLPTCERALAIEGVAQLELVTGGEYLHHLPRSLARLTFLRFLQPKPRAGDFAIESSKPKPGASDLAVESSKLEFWKGFWPSGWPCHRVFAAWLSARISTKAGAGDLAIESPKLEFWQSVQPKPRAGELAVESSMLEFWLEFQPKPGAGELAVYEYDEVD